MVGFLVVFARLPTRKVETVPTAPPGDLTLATNAITPGPFRPGIKLFGLLLVSSALGCCQGQYCCRQALSERLNFEPDKLQDEIVRSALAPPRPKRTANHLLTPSTLLLLN